ncbi:MAG: hypothetical protein OXG88_06065 [Gammaproteobacteria bacterium]|nr:hypothetical protein [Gammaproteobacteria bacterium]
MLLLQIVRRMQSPSLRMKFAVLAAGNVSPEQKEFAPSLAFDVGSA